MCIFREKKGSVEERNEPAVGCAPNTCMNMHLLVDNWVLDGERTTVKIQQDSNIKTSLYFQTNQPKLIAFSFSLSPASRTGLTMTAKCQMLIF